MDLKPSSFFHIVEQRYESAFTEGIADLTEAATIYGIIVALNALGIKLTFRRIYLRQISKGEQLADALLHGKRQLRHMVEKTPHMPEFMRHYRCRMRARQSIEDYHFLYFAFGFLPVNRKGFQYRDSGLSLRRTARQSVYFIEIGQAQWYLNLCIDAQAETL